MKNALKYIGISFIGMLVISCKTHSVSIKSADISGPTVIQKPVIADLEVKETKVSGTATGKGATSTEELKREAVNDALVKSGADVLIEPRYEVTIKFNKATVNVTGYPATYKNFRPMEPGDTIFVSKTPLTSSVNNAHPREFTKNTSRKGRIALMSVGGFVGAFLIAGLVALII